LKRLLRHPWVQGAGAWLLGLYLCFALRTTRWTLIGAENFAPFAAGAPAIAAFWHERLPLMSMLWLMARSGRWGSNKGQRLHVLVSRHRDGRFIGHVVGRFRIAAVHGSSSRGGASALRALAGLLVAGDHVVVTPDGPRGPRRVAAPGVAQLAALSGASVLPCSAQTSRRLVLHSWDRMVIPRPFGRGVVVCEPAIAVDRTDWRAALPAIEAAMTRAAEQADAACPA
jgi:lysophospholipid acyltransferase (LPLAT)-like uncharacterized protein